MIPRITKGRSATGALRYDHGRGKANEHHNPHRIGGNAPGRTWQERAAWIDGHARRSRPEVAQPIHRTALRIAPGDRPLTDREWRQVAEQYVQAMGFESCPWEATRHADDHIHLTVCRVQWDGTLASTSHDFARAQVAARAIEREHGLIDASQRYNRDAPQVHQLTEGQAAQRTGTEPVKAQLREHIDAAIQECDGTRNAYELALKNRGVEAVPNVASTGRVSGYRYALQGHTDAQGAPVWHKGSQLGKAYGWSRTQEALRARAHVHAKEEKAAQAVRMTAARRAYDEAKEAQPMSLRQRIQARAQERAKESGLTPAQRAARAAAQAQGRPATEAARQTGQDGSASARARAARQRSARGRGRGGIGR